MDGHVWNWTVPKDSKWKVCKILRYPNPKVYGHQIWTVIKVNGPERWKWTQNVSIKSWKWWSVLTICVGSAKCTAYKLFMIDTVRILEFLDRLGIFETGNRVGYTGWIVRKDTWLEQSWKWTFTRIKYKIFEILKFRRISVYYKLLPATCKYWWQNVTKIKCRQHRLDGFFVELCVETMIRILNIKGFLVHGRDFDSINLMHHD